MVSVFSLQIILMVVFPLFMFVPVSQAGKLEYLSKLRPTLIYQISVGVILALLYKSYAIIFFQLAIVLAQLLLTYSIFFKSKLKATIAAQAEKFVITVVVILILLSTLPFKGLVILALVGNRILNYMLIHCFMHFSKNKISIIKKYLIYFMCIIYLLVMFWAIDGTNFSDEVFKRIAYK